MTKLNCPYYIPIQNTKIKPVHNKVHQMIFHVQRATCFFNTPLFTIVILGKREVYSTLLNFEIIMLATITASVYDSFLRNIAKLRALIALILDYSDD